MRSTSTLRIAGFTLLSVVATVIMPTVTYAENLEAIVSFDEVKNEATSTTRVYRHARDVYLSVTDGSRVSDWGSRRPGRPNERAQNVNGRVGTPVPVGIATLAWRLDGPEIVVRETNYPSFSETIRITFHPDGCDAVVAYRLKPSYAFFGMWDLKTGMSMAINRMWADNVRCRLGAVPIS